MRAEQGLQNKKWLLRHTARINRAAQFPLSVTNCNTLIINSDNFQYFLRSNQAILSNRTSKPSQYIVRNLLQLHRSHQKSQRIQATNWAPFQSKMDNWGKTSLTKILFLQKRICQSFQLYDWKGWIAAQAIYISTKRNIHPVTFRFWQMVQVEMDQRAHCTTTISQAKESHLVDSDFMHFQLQYIEERN